MTTAGGTVHPDQAAELTRRYQQEAREWAKRERARRAVSAPEEPEPPAAARTRRWRRQRGEARA
ncbi:hypothetical protein HDA32_003906 [Spinactinospora alkalitolerans]|uniref:Uncharacterized protein n=1 Tax=Spinactinospora alkalitolerans TaxID=687207 RepID=A0A852TW94_9ACTN|nr:hypothetical protein [Spinactinospora alkalitolerans]NYE48786.1 hypothetical protein [Spinactinospora alkalitolerans]